MVIKLLVINTWSNESFKTDWWWLEPWNFILHILGIVILTDELIFFRGVGQPPTRLMIGPWRGKWWQTVHGVEPLVFANPTILPLSTHLSSKSPEFPVGTHIFSYIGSRSRPLIGNLKRLAVFKQQTRGFGRFGHPRNYVEHCPHDISMRISYTN